jgi:glycosyltransferase involved in cell wall biosynthesis
MLQTLLDGALQTEHEIALVFLEPGPWANELAEAGFAVDVIAAGRLREPHHYVGSVMRLARILRRRRPDVILNWSAKTQLYGAPAAVFAGMASRVVWWQHDIPARRGINLAATALPARAIGCTSHSAARAQARLYPRRATFVVHAGVAVPQAPAPTPSLTLPQGALVVGMVGRLQPWKGQDRLLRAHAILRERGHAVHTLIVGGDSGGLSPGYAASLPLLIAELGLANEVTMTGEVPEAGPYIERMDVVVNASDPEPFGIVLLEAMSRGVAVVAVDAGGPRELIEHERTGMLARSGDPGDLADALEPLLADAGRRHAIADAGRMRFAADLTDVAMRRRFFKALQGLLEDSASLPR